MGVAYSLMLATSSGTGFGVVSTASVPLQQRASYLLLPPAVCHCVRPSRAAQVGTHAAAGRGTQGGHCAAGWALRRLRPWGSVLPA